MNPPNPNSTAARPEAEAGQRDKWTLGSQRAFRHAPLAAMAGWPEAQGLGSRCNTWGPV